MTSPIILSRLFACHSPFQVKNTIEGSAFTIAVKSYQVTSKYWKGIFKIGKENPVPLPHAPLVNRRFMAHSVIRVLELDFYLSKNLKTNPNDT